MPEILTARELAPAHEPLLHSVSLHVVAVFTCPCGRTPLVITGVSEIRACPGCAARYMIASITHTPHANGQFETNVQVGRLSALAVGRPAFEITRRS